MRDKNIFLQLLAAIFCVLVIEGCASKKMNPWATITLPSSGESKAIGNYTAGCLQGGKTLYPDGSGYRVMRVGRRRFYGHSSLIQFIEALGVQVIKSKFKPILVGDLAQPRGGPSFPGHGSHQNGLDVDVWFLTPEQIRLTLGERELISAVPVVKDDNSGLIDRWSNRERTILKMASSFDEVDRIFVSPWVKKELCTLFKGEDWLGKIRPWWGHEDHFHVRLKCPKENVDCISQAPVPLGDGCDWTLDWWFSEEATLEAVKRKETLQSYSLPNLPEACKSFLEK